MRRIPRCLGPATIVLLVSILICTPVLAYSVLTHEEIVDLVWTSEIRPLLLKRFPAATPDQITKRMGTRMAEPSFRISVTTRSAIMNSATSSTTRALATSSVS